MIVVIVFVNVSDRKQGGVGSSVIIVFVVGKWTVW